ncbi:MAG: alpha/beta hydrolase family protein [Thermodesulfobacteriota bacterium]
MTKTSQHDHIIRGLFVKEYVPGESSRRTPLLMVHGGCHGWWAYEKWLPCFAEAGWRSLALSLRNHTGSYRLPPGDFLTLRVEDYVEDVLHVIAWIGTAPVLLGHSMGGIIVQKVAEKVPLAALVLVEPVGPGQLGAIRPPFRTDVPVHLDSATVRRSWFHDIDDDTFRGIYDRLVPESPSVINEYSGGEVLVDPGKIECPILVVGARFGASVLHRTDKIAGFFSADWFIVPDCGHDLMLEPAAPIAASQVDTWLKSRVP